MKRIATKLISNLVVFLVAGALLVNVSFANFIPDSGPDIPHIYIRNDGSIQPETSLIEKTGNIYKLTDDIIEYTVDIECENIVLDGVGYFVYGDANRIKGYDDGNNGVIINGQRNVTVKNINFEQGATGIRVSNSSDLTVVGNSFSNGILTGVTLSNVTQILIQNNTFTDLNTDIGVPAVKLRGSQITFQNNTITGRSYGVELAGSSNVISDNTIGGTSQSIMLKGTDSNIISRNNLTGDIYIVGCSNSTFFGNNFNGVRMLVGSNNTFFGNYLKNNRIYYTLEFDSGSTNNTFYGNLFAVNFTVRFSDSGPIFWDNGTIGNYWSEYNGTDINQDGIGDSPYLVTGVKWDKEVRGDVTFVGGQDNFPLMNPVDIGEIPEFSSWIVLPIFLVCSFSVVLLKKKLLSNK